MVGVRGRRKVRTQLNPGYNYDGATHVYGLVGSGTSDAWGRDRAATHAYDWLPQEFTSKERDSETGLDWFESRYFSSAQGRFTSPDSPLAGQSPSNPQSWNLYSYGLNNPLRYNDPTGHDAEEADRADDNRPGKGCQGPLINCAAPGFGQQKLNAEQEGILKTIAGCLFGPIGCIVGAFADPPAVGEGSNPPTLRQALIEQTKGIALGAVVGGSLSPEEAAISKALEAEGGIVAQNGTRVTGFTAHGIDRVVGDTAERAGTRPEAILDALKNPQKIVKGVDQQGRPFEVFTGKDARVVVNPQSGKVVSVNPKSGAGASK